MVDIGGLSSSVGYIWSNSLSKFLSCCFVVETRRSASFILCSRLVNMFLSRSSMAGKSKRLLENESATLSIFSLSWLPQNTTMNTETPFFLPGLGFSSSISICYVSTYDFPLVDLNINLLNRTTSVDSITPATCDILIAFSAAACISCISI